MSHKCHAKGCNIDVDPRLLMCLRHWRLLPAPLKRAVWRHYREGQERTKDPSAAYMEAQRAAIDAVARIEATRRPKRPLRLPLDE